MPEAPRPSRPDRGEPADALGQEQAYLDRARADLARMRERVLGLGAMGGDAVSEAYLASTLATRARALVDDPDTPLFFGRTDTDEGRWYVGRRHVQDAHGDPTVVDWRADISRPFYRATRAEPMGVRLRRRYGFAGGTLTAYEDEHLTDPGERSETSAILAAEIQRPRTGPMRDIVATIQPDQDALVRYDVAQTVCVQGAPGTGKTAVGLHRIAYLLYAHRERLARSGVLVVGPNASFLGYIGQVLPALGELDVAHTTVEGLTAGPIVRGVDTDATARLKGDARMAALLHRAVWSHLRRPTEPLVVTLGSRRWRVPASVVRDAVDSLRERGVRYSTGRALLPQRLAHEALVQLEREGVTTDDRDQARVARHPATKAYVSQHWPAVTATRVVFELLSDAAVLAKHSDGSFSEDELDLIGWVKPPRTPGRAPWSPADLVLVDEVNDLLDRTPSLGHVVVDEAQDLSAMQLRAIGRRCTTGSATVLGDLAQTTTSWGVGRWDLALGHLGKPDSVVEELSQGFRVPSAVIDFAARLLPHLVDGLRPPTSIREDPGLLELLPTNDVPATTVAAVRAALERPGSIGVITADRDATAAVGWLRAAGLAVEPLGQDGTADTRVTVVPAGLAKGLEYDSVVVVEPADIVAAEARGLNRLYVVLTRAVTSLAVVHAQALPDELH